MAKSLSVPRNITMPSNCDSFTSAKPTTSTCHRRKSQSSSIGGVGGPGTTSAVNQSTIKNTSLPTVSGRTNVTSSAINTRVVLPEVEATSRSNVCIDAVGPSSRCFCSKCASIRDLNQELQSARLEINRLRNRLRRPSSCTTAAATPIANTIAANSTTTATTASGLSSVVNNNLACTYSISGQCACAVCLSSNHVTCHLNNESNFWTNFSSSSFCCSLSLSGTYIPNHTFFYLIDLIDF